MSPFILISEAISYNFILADPLWTLPLKCQYSTEVLLLSKRTMPTAGKDALSSNYGAEMAGFNQRLIQVRYESRFFLKSAPDYTFAATCLGGSWLTGQECRSDFAMCQQCVNHPTW